MNRRKAFLMNPKDCDELRERIAAPAPFYQMVGYPRYAVLGGINIYAHEKQPVGEVIEGPEDEIWRIIEGWQIE